MKRPGLQRPAARGRRTRVIGVVANAGIFLISSAVTIGAALLVKRTDARAQHGGANHIKGDIIFSLEKEEVWASWHGLGSSVRLGPRTRVSAMMNDFLAQDALAEGLCRGAHQPTS